MRQILLEIPIWWLAAGAGLLTLAAGLRGKTIWLMICGGALVALALIGRLVFEEQIADWKLPIFGFGTMLFVAFVSAAWLAQWRARQDGLDGERVVDLGIWMFVVGILGARLLFVLRNPEQFHSLLDFFKIWQGGIVFYGGVIAATLVYLVYTRHYDLPAWRVLDVLAPSVALGAAVGRLGCLLNGCCWGKPTDLPWGIRFPYHSIPWESQVQQGLIPPDAPTSLPVHPTQMYLALAGFVLVALTMAYYPYRRRHGEVMALLMIGYSVSRFLLEFLRGDELPTTDHLTVSQNISLVLLAGGILLWGWLRRRPPIPAAGVGQDGRLRSEGAGLGTVKDTRARRVEV